VEEDPGAGKLESAGPVGRTNVRISRGAKTAPVVPVVEAPEGNGEGAEVEADEPTVEV
jgi:hypothetical protein